METVLIILWDYRC